MTGSARIDPAAGVSFVVPVYNGARTLDAALTAILAEADGRPLEVVVVDDGSTDESRAIVERHAAVGPIRVLEGERRGSAAATNVGIRAARYPVICQVDQDVVIEPGWLKRITQALAETPAAAAVQGCYVTPPDAGVLERVMGLDLLHRYSRIAGPYMNHVCTGTTAYRRDALEGVGLFDPTMGYGHDNDISYRLTRAGYRLGFCREARSLHLWRTTLRRYLLQQYGFGYGRLDVIAKHPHHVTGDQVSPFGMMFHAPAMLLVLALIPLALALGLFGAPWVPAGAAAGLLLGLLFVERTAAGVVAARRFGDSAAFLFPVVHLLRDVAWAWAILVWLVHRVVRRGRRSADSMFR